MDLIYAAIKIITIPDIFSNKYSNYSNTFFERRNQLAVEESASEEKAAAEEEAVEKAVEEAGAAPGLAKALKAEGAAQGPFAKALKALKAVTSAGAAAVATVNSIAVRQAAGEEEEKEEEEKEEEEKEEERAAAEKETPEERNNHDAEPDIIRGDSSAYDNSIAIYLKKYGYASRLTQKDIIEILQQWRELKEKDWINTVPVNDNPHLVELDINSEEYKIIESVYHITCDFSRRRRSSKCAIERIERVHNKIAWNNFINKAIDEQGNNYCDIPLWHGTSRTDPSLIYRDEIGLKTQFSGSVNGRLYGDGIYMALNASYSNSSYPFFTKENTKLKKSEAQIFLMRARVTSIPQDVYQSYDSIYVFKKESYCYPEYLISYSYSYI
jgi:hypothetical protein